MTNPADNPCTCRACGVLILNEVVSICPDCEAESDSLAEEARKIDNAIHGRSDCDCGYDDDRACPNCSTMEDEEREDAERDRQMTIDNWCREADNQAFADACGQMTREDWDADNDWLASAGWGEM
jgi:hypothetical protein